MPSCSALIAIAALICASLPAIEVRRVPSETTNIW